MPPDSRLLRSANTAYAVLRVGAATQLYTINLATGAAAAVGSIGGNPLLDGLTSLPPYDVFDPKPSTDGPTPLVHQILVHVQDLPPRVVQFQNPALNPIVAVDPDISWWWAMPMASFRFKR